MDMSTILIANTIFLAFILVLLVFIIEKSSQKPRDSVQEDMDKIKDQINNS